jgi:hypothetical protein
MSSNKPEMIIRWTARIWAVASLLFLSAFIFGDGERSGNWPTIPQWIGLAFFPTGIIVGLLIAFQKELLGGGITVLSLIGFYVWHFVVAGQLAAGPWFALLAAPGFLFVLAGLLVRRPLRGRKATPATVPNERGAFSQGPPHPRPLSREGRGEKCKAGALPRGEMGEGETRRTGRSRMEDRG